MGAQWLPGAACERAWADGGEQAGVSRAIWIASGLDSSYSALLTARYLNHVVRPSHLVWDPQSGDLVQMIPADHMALHGPSEARTGAIQIVVCSPKGEPFTRGPCRGLDQIMAWLNDHLVPTVAPLGPPAPSTPAPGPTPGHYCIDTGSVDYERIFRAAGG